MQEDLNVTIRRSAMRQRTEVSVTRVIRMGEPIRLVLSVSPDASPAEILAFAGPQLNDTEFLHVANTLEAGPA